ncbi:MAG: hypothetical protein HC802_09130 [Caldilineaceae bacterium]|nr:hypothetical protein [Caldilineaceae bacterium]
MGALVSSLDADSTTVELVNTSPLHTRRLIVQAGAFGEHEFTSAEPLDSENGSATIGNRHLTVELPAGRSLRLRLGMKRYCHTPSYGQPV